MLMWTLSPPRRVCGAGGWWVRMSSLFWKTVLVCCILVERTLQAKQTLKDALQIKQLENGREGRGCRGSVLFLYYAMVQSFEFSLL